MVGAVQDGDVGERRAGTAQRFDSRQRALALVHLVVAFDDGDRVAGTELAPQLLLVQLGVVADHRVGGGEDAAGRAIVLLQRDDLELRIVGGQALQILDRRAAPAIDALVVVTDRREEPALAGEQLHQLVLDPVRVLVLVDEDIAQARPPRVAPRHRGEVGRLHIQAAMGGVHPRVQRSI